MNFLEFIGAYFSGIESNLAFCATFFGTVAVLAGFHFLYRFFADMRS